ncbi:Sucrose 6(F)-phosphate phosphorylase [Mixta intestinalis]|uniref:Sucrose 6(F)-phosphate phosphorylase n=1 Tax=Mixta intestinalis TaxID=1615494 RepID=A0A6P1Q4X5_9GAMM|nr:Sucrose 6(F)-phosphate phosphorylase [Mixta intestinalis]
MRDLALEGALVSYKNNPDGTTSPYEINVTLMDALSKQDDDDDTRIRRFMLAHAILLAFPGVPAIYIQSILGSRNDNEGVKVAGHNRAINREKYALSFIEKALAGGDYLRQQIFNRLSALIQLRTRQPAFHPDNPLEILDGDNRLLIMRRYTPDRENGLLCLFNLSSKSVDASLPEAKKYRDIVEQRVIDGARPVTLAPWGYLWLKGQQA